jgi:hypothetical protein
MGLMVESLVSSVASCHIHGGQQQFRSIDHAYLGRGFVVLVSSLLGWLFGQYSCPHVLTAIST